MTLKRTTPLNAFSAKRWEKVTASGFRPTSTFTPWPREPLTAKAQARRSTGPKQSQTTLLFKRSLRICEWPDCWQPATDKHHRLNRKDGGRHGEMRDRLNGVAWLLHACRVHHAYVTSPHGFRRQKAIEMGWLLLEGQDAQRVPVLTRHDEEPIWLLPNGTWLRFEEACA